FHRLDSKYPQGFLLSTFFLSHLFYIIFILIVSFKKPKVPYNIDAKCLDGK
ncbi:hypothetical protein LCGC14_2231840, partial [marine sediment metagenome]